MSGPLCRAAFAACILLGCGSVGVGPPADAGDETAGEAGKHEEGGEASVGVDASSLPPSIGPVDLGWGAETQIAVAGNRIVIAWIGREDAGYRVSYALSTDRGATFPNISALAEASAGDPVAAATPDGSLFIGGLGSCSAGCGGRVAVARSAKGTTTFESAVTLDNPYYVDHPWLTAATDGRLTLIYNPRDLTGNPPTFAGSGIQAATSVTGETWETHDVVPVEAHRNMYLATGNVDGTTSYALFFDLAAPFGQTLRKSADGKEWSPTATLPGRVGAYLGDAVRAASRGLDVWLLYGLAGVGGGESSAAVYHQGLALVHSPDGGDSWGSGAMIVNDGRLYMLPELTIERSGALDLVYYSANRDLDPDASFEWIRSTDGGATWSRPVVLQRGILFKAQRRVPDWLGDYVAMVTDGDFVHFAWTSNETGQAMVEYARRLVP